MGIGNLALKEYTELAGVPAYLSRAGIYLIARPVAAGRAVFILLLLRLLHCVLLDRL